MQKSIIKRTILATLFLFLFIALSSQTDRKGIIPFDSITQKYSYSKINDISAKSAIELYDLGKKWLILNFRDDKFLIDERPSKVIDLGSFPVSAVYDAGRFKMNKTWLITFNLSLSYQDGKSRLDISSIKLAPAKEPLNEVALEDYEKSITNTDKGEKKNMKRYLYDLFKEIDSNMKKVISEYEANISSTTK